MKRTAFLAASLLVTVASTTTVDASAGATSVALGDVAAPPDGSGVDRASLKTAAERELLVVDASQLRKHRNVLVSVAVIGALQEPFGCTISAVLHDAKTGTMLAIIEGRARAVTTGTADVRQQVLRAAMHSALGQIPAALAAN